jgi:hypothetical protein
MTNKLVHSAFIGFLLYHISTVGHILPLSQFAMGQDPQVLAQCGQDGVINIRFLTVFKNLKDMVSFGMQIYIVFNEHVPCRSEVLLVKLNDFVDQLQCKAYYHTTYLLTFQGHMGQYCPMKIHPVCPERKNTAL